MALARKCDRCGVLYESYNVSNDKNNINGFMPLNIDDKQQYWGHDVIDLCPKCSAALMKWFKKEGEL